MEKKQYLKVDILTYVSEGIKEGRLQFAEAVKFKRIYAVRGVEGQPVQTILADGTVETDVRYVTVDKETGEPGWIVRNVNGLEQWIISNKTFIKKYDLEDAEHCIYKPKGGPMMVAQISDDLEFEPPKWGGDVQRINAGGYLVMDPSNPTDIYGIGEKEFLETYKISDKPVVKIKK